MINNIKVIENFMSEEDMKFFRHYNDYLLENKYDKFIKFYEGKRPVLSFGKDLYHKERSHLTLDVVKEKEAEIRGLFSDVTNKIKEVFNDEDELYVCSLWIAKQEPGAEVEIHEDTDGGVNTHFKYSCILYLNTLSSGGELVFTDLDYTYKPKAGDLVVFESQTTGRHMVPEIPEERYTIPMWITADKDFAI
jgi:hypothetical protein